MEATVGRTSRFVMRGGVQDARGAFKCPRRPSTGARPDAGLHSRIAALHARDNAGVWKSIVLFVALGVAALSTSAIASVPKPRGSGGTGPACGTERWTVKTLQDRPRLLPVKDTTIAFLVSRPAPRRLPDTRLPFERHVYRVHAAVTLVREADDFDLSLVLQDAKRRHMTADAPLPACAPGATAYRRKQMAKARAAVRRCSKGVVTGVAFFDFKHGQTGVAPNAIELHPVLAFRCA